MSNGTIVRLIPLAASQIGGVSTATTGFDAAFPVSNLADRQPKTVMQTAVASGVNNVMIDIDLLADTAIDTVAVLFTNLSQANGVWQVYGANQATGFGAAFAESAGQRILGFGGYASFGIAPTTLENRRHAVATGTSATVRYIRIYLRDNSSTNPESLIRAGVVAIGQRILPAFNFELGSGRKVEDQSIVRTLPGGETATEEGGKTPMWRGTFSNLSEAEMRSLWSLQMEVGTSRPLLFVEDTDPIVGQAEAIHYCQLASLDFNERIQPEKQRWDLTVRELV